MTPLIEFDPTKDRINREKHGISLARAADFDWRNAVAFEDDRQDYGEERQVAHGYIGRRLYTIVYTFRDEYVRVISLRPADRQGRAVYHTWR